MVVKMSFAVGVCGLESLNGDDCLDEYILMPFRVVCYVNTKTMAALDRYCSVAIILPVRYKYCTHLLDTAVILVANPCRASFKGRLQDGWAISNRFGDSQLVSIPVLILHTMHSDAPPLSFAKPSAFLFRPRNCL